MKSSFAAIWIAAIGVASCGSSREPATPCAAESADCNVISPEAKQRLAELVLPKTDPPDPDVTNRYADNPAAAALGKKFFYDTRFSGPLLDDANDGTSGTLGKQGEAGKVGCVGCHMPENNGFVDTRSPRQQLSLGSGWTHRRAPSLLDESRLTFLMWDGRRDSVFSQVFSPIESPLEFNSSRLFVAQQVSRLYRAEYEAVFGPMAASVDTFPALAPTDAGCATMPADPVKDRCPKAGQDDEGVVRVVVNFGKAIQAFTRQFACGRSRFDDWVDGNATVLTADERAGAALFVGKGACTTCHIGPHLTDRRFHNLGLGGGIVEFTGVDTSNDPGASSGIADMLADPLNAKGVFSDGYDGRDDALPTDTSTFLGAFHTPSLRCVSRRPSFMHNAKFRSLEDLIDSFSQPDTDTGYVGTPQNFPRNFSTGERGQLIAFLRALDGTGPDPSLRMAPTLP